MNFKIADQSFDLPLFVPKLLAPTPGNVGRRGEVFIDIPINGRRSAVIFTTRQSADNFLAKIKKHWRNVKGIRTSELGSAAEVLRHCDSLQANGFKYVALDVKINRQPPEPLAVQALAAVVQEALARNGA